MTPHRPILHAKIERKSLREVKSARSSKDNFILALMEGSTIKGYYVSITQPLTETRDNASVFNDKSLAIAATGAAKEQFKPRPNQTFVVLKC